MKKLTFRRLAVMSLLFVVVSGIAAGIVNLASPSQASALTAAEQTECYTQFNGKEIDFSRADTATQTLYNTKCATICKKDKLYDSAGSLRTEVKVTCANPSSIPEETTKKVYDARLAPVWKVICGDAPAGEAAQSVYVACTAKVEAAYTSCNTTGGGITGAMQASDEDLGKCIKEKTGSGETAADIIRAVTQGRGDADNVLNEYYQKQLEAENPTCNTGESLVDGKCTKNSTDATCAGGALGWFLCPLVIVMDNLNQKMAPLIESMLKIDMMTNTSSKGALQSIWQLLVGIANLLLVVAFLVVIFSQATSIGLSAYGIKKMLPRIIAAAILINLSFFLCGVLVDIFNILGGAVKGIIAVGMQAVPDPQNQLIKAHSGDLVTSIAAWITVLSGVLAAGAVLAVTGLLAFILPIIASGTLATLGFFVAIALRQVLIVLLIVIAPIAIAAMILPNTEPLFKKWMSGFIKLLALYPVMAAVMYGCTLVAKIILAGQ